MSQGNEMLLNRFQGCLLGLAIGDAVGTTLEFKPRGSFEPMVDMVGGGPFNLKPGQWTDDTSMALCLAQSLLYCQGFNPQDQMNRYCDWWKSGYMSSNGRCFDIGMTVLSALDQYLKTQDPYSGSVDPMSAGNGSLMRLAPIPLFYFDRFPEMIKYAAESSRTTHGAAECIDACKYYSSLIYAALQGEDKSSILTDGRYQPETEGVSRIASGEYRFKKVDQIIGSGYVINSMEAALWCFAHTDTYKDAVLAAANLGGDADTTAAITGQLAGAHYGLSLIPESWVNSVAEKELLFDLSDRLLRKA
ncbi:ADP-ribosylglycohydrolase family protein [Litoribacillus peritrichatus]|uniref:ADP-ribosylglycohydrolase family protein n=1 Tax=Litoribacillus peritrichatus TaxID=718191 RepID=A0ABP7MVV5_9GAMM